MIDRRELFQYFILCILAIGCIALLIYGIKTAREDIQFENATSFEISGTVQNIRIVYSEGQGLLRIGTTIENYAEINGKEYEISSSIKDLLSIGERFKVSGKSGRILSVESSQINRDH